MPATQQAGQKKIIIAENRGNDQWLRHWVKDTVKCAHPHQYSVAEEAYLVARSLREAGEDVTVIIGQPEKWFIHELDPEEEVARESFRDSFRALGLDEEDIIDLGDYPGNSAARIKAMQGKLQQVCGFCFTEPATV